MRPLPGKPADDRRSRRLFLLCCIGAAAFIIAVLLFFWFLPVSGLTVAHEWLIPLTAVFCSGLVAGLLVLIAGLAPLALSGRRWFGTPRFWRRVLRFLLPVVEVVARLWSGGDTSGSRLERVRRAFIVLNNELVLDEGLHCAPEQLLILLPHCLQASQCPLRLTHHPDNCKRCGRCTLRDFLDLRDALGVRLAVAPGGTIARRIVRRDRPRIIVAVACERDLSAGIQDTAPLPVYGVLNERPNGPCMDTGVSMESVRAAVKMFVAEEKKN